MIFFFWKRLIYGIIVSGIYVECLWMFNFIMKYKSYRNSFYYFVFIDGGVFYCIKVSEDSFNKIVLNKIVLNFCDINNLLVVEKKFGENVNFRYMIMFLVIVEVEENLNILKRYLLEGIVVSKEVVICCVEFLKFFCFMDEDEEIKIVVLIFVIENDIFGLIF